LIKRNHREWLNFRRTVRFGETDAAGVVHFLQLFKWCHEAWEESLEEYGIALKDIFPTEQFNVSELDVALPVVKCEANYLKPLYVGDIINIEIYPERINDCSFILRFEVKKDGKQIATTNIKHLSINPITREKCSLTKQINLWIDESVFDF
tara:strand:+ start:631 stop:1083 length:453 start_codon:yes stop_codon:yes gene_type:complete